VLDAPKTLEAERKRSGELAQYWFRYREQTGLVRQAEPSKRKVGTYWVPYTLILMGLIVLVAAGGLLLRSESPLDRIETNFKASDEATLRQQGWFVQGENRLFWNRRVTPGGGLTLFTLKGDNWPQAGHTARIQNLLLRPIRNECFQTEVHLREFVPSGNWQQAGLLLLEDTLFQGKSIRLSLSYNDYFGGLVKPGEILLQAIAANGQHDPHLEELIHLPLFQLTTAADHWLAVNNLKNVALRVEKQGSQFRFLYSVSPLDNFSFREVFRTESEMRPRYVGLFALKGFVDTTDALPVQVRYFRLAGQACKP
jgi:hypothetical protein